MHTTNTLLDAVKARLCLPSDYALARHFGVTKQRIYEYRRGATCLGDAKAIEIAEFLELDPAAVLLSVQAERATKQHLPHLADILSAAVRRLSAIAVAVFLCFALAPIPDSAAAFTRPALDNNTNYATWTRRPGAPMLALAFALLVFCACPFLFHRVTLRALFSQTRETKNHDYMPTA